MPSFGEKLKAEREKRSITLEQISISTKIGTRMLQAMEEDKFQQLPGGIFNKGFVRAYARFVGMDEDQAVAEYLEASGENAPARPGSDADESATTPILIHESRRESVSSEKSRELPWGLFAAALLAIALALSLWTQHKRNTVLPATSNEGSQPGPAVPETSSLRPASVQPAEPGTPKPGTVQNRVTPPDSNAPADSSGSVSAVKPAAVPQPSATASSAPATPQLPAARAVSAPGEFTVLIQVHEDSWISITSDGKTLASYLANAGAERAVRGRELVTVKAGNIGGVDFIFNGKKLTPQGESGQVKTLSFGPEGLQPTPLSVAQ